MRRLLSCVLLILPGLWGQGRVVVLGVDGLDHALTAAFIREGRLPELARLAEEGTFAPLRPTNPAQSPTSWASIVTGRNPGETGIFGFLRRGARDDQVVPELALAEAVEAPVMGTGTRSTVLAAVVLVSLLPLLLLRRRRALGFWISAVLVAVLGGGTLWLLDQVPESMRVPRSRLTGEPLWHALDREGVATDCVYAPCAFPAPELGNGRLLCGLGVPDVLATHGTTALFRDEPVPGGVRETMMGGREVALVRTGEEGVLEGAFLEGPRDPRSGERPRVPVTFVARGDGTVEVAYQDVRTVLEPRRFSAFLPVTFRFGPFIAVHGTVRYRLQRAGPRPVVYQEPVQFDPRRQVPTAPITSPPAFGRELAEPGPFETLGWAAATNPLNDGLIDEEAFLEDARRLAAERERTTLLALRSGRWRAFFAVLSTPDRVQHVFWRDRDPGHPAHDAAAATERGDVVREFYERIDRFVGVVRRKVLREDDVLLVVSDHGFASWRHSVNLNVWLAREGYLAGRPDGGRSLANGLGRPAFAHLDWSRTRAYSLGLGRIWLNLRGREPQGSVAPGGAAALAAEIRGKLLALRHEGRPVVRSVRLAEEIYRGARVGESADLVVGFERGYRVSWQSCLGGLDEPLIGPNRHAWSGDHCSVDPDLVPGVIFCNRPFADGPASVTDVYPTVRAALGLEPKPGLDGRSLLP